VLDLGCGPNSPVQHCSQVKYSVGVEVFTPYYEQALNNRIHSELYNKDIFEVRFQENAFDAVLLVEVVEHLPYDMGLKLVELAKKWARKKVIITTPNGYIKQRSLDENPYQEHKSGWTVQELKDLGFAVRGLAGLKCLRHEVEGDSMSEGSMLSSIAWRPKSFWFLMASLSQIITYYKPNLAFELFCINNLEN
jgi:SAM-dependent methyltransferase